MSSIGLESFSYPAEEGISLLVLRPPLPTSYLRSLPLEVEAVSVAM